MPIPNPLVSVIVPCYNTGKYLRVAIESALRQTHTNLEVIVVNDGSTDDTQSIIGDLEATDHRVIGITQNNGGLSRARNTGLRASRGEFVNFLDADDWFEPTKLERQIAQLNDHPDAGFSYCDIQTEKEVDDPSVDLSYSVGEARQVRDGDIFGSLLLGGYFPPLSVLIRRSAIDIVGEFREDLAAQEDYDYWLRCAASGILARYLDQRLAHYRFHQTNMSRDSQLMDDMRARTLDQIVSEFPKAVAKHLNSLLSTLSEYDKSHKWHRVQLATYQAENADLRDWISRLEADRDALAKELELSRTWYSQQQSLWEKTLQQHVQDIRELKGWITELETGRDWLANQVSKWQKEAERLASPPSNSNGPNSEKGISATANSDKSG